MTEVTLLDVKRISALMVWTKPVAQTYTAKNKALFLLSSGSQSTYRQNWGETFGIEWNPFYLQYLEILLLTE